MLDYDKEEETPLEDVVCRTFSVDVMIGEETGTVDLVPNGSEKYVNFNNKEEFVRLFMDFDIK